jgi:hypothetical protein
LELFVIAAARGHDYRLVMPIQLEYTAPADCPTQAEFVAKVTSRGGNFENPSSNPSLRAIIVSLRREAKQHAGSLQLRSSDVPSEPRVVHAESCAEVADALAVVTAIALGAPEESPPPPPPAAGAAAVVTSAEAVPKAPPAAVPAQPSPPADTRLRPTGVWGPEAVPVTSGELRVDRSLAATLSGGVVLGAIPGFVLPRFDLDLARANFVSTPDRASYLIGNVFGVRWSYFGNATHRIDDHSTEMSGFKAGINACASFTYDTNGFVFLLCSGFAIGRMHLETQQLGGDYKQTKDLGLGSASLELNSRYNIGKLFHVALAVSGELWVSELTAERADGSQLFHSNLFNANAQLGVGLHF